MTTAIYARISEDRQDGAGVARQLEDCRRLVEAKGWDSVEEYVDESISAFSGKKRPAYLRMLTELREGRADRVVAYHIDRLYRRPRELEDLIDLADTGRVQVVTVHAGDLNLANSDGRAMARVLVAMAAKESEDKSRRVRRAKQQARELGLAMGGHRAFGWSADRAPHPTEAALVVEAVDHLLAGASLGQLARDWTARGIRRPRGTGKPWTADGIRQVVSNPRHAGLVGYREPVKGKDGRVEYAASVPVSRGKWAPIVEPDRWHRLQALIAERGADHHMPRRRSLLTGLVLCDVCGATMVRTGARGAYHRAPGEPSRKIWRCPAVRGCGRVTIAAGTGRPREDQGAPLDGLETLLVEATLERADTSELAAMVRQQAAANGASDEVMRLGALEDRLREVEASYAAGKVELRTLERVTAKVESERRQLQSTIARRASTAALEPYLGRPGLLAATWSALDVDTRRTIIGIVIGKVRIRPALTPGRPTFDPDRVVLN